MKILFITYAYPPLRYPRSIQVARLAKHLPVDRLRVIAAEEDGPGDPSPLEGVDPEKVQVTRVPWSRAARLRRLVHRRVGRDRLVVPDPYRPWVRNAVTTVLRDDDARTADAMITFGQPMSVHFAGLRLRHLGIPWIAHFSDPWVANPLVPVGGLRTRVHSRCERSVVLRADAVVFTADETRELVLERFPANVRERAFVVPHAFDPDLYPSDAEPPRAGPVNVRHLGNFYGARSPAPVLEALALLRGRVPNIEARLRVEFIGPDAQRTQALAAAAGVSSLVAVHKPVDYRTSLRLMAEAHALLVIDAPGTHSVFLPSKLVDYLGARRPIVGVTPPGPAARLVVRSGGKVADPSNVSAIAEVLAETLHGGVGGGRVTSDVYADHEARRVATDVAALLRSVAGARGTPREVLGRRGAE